MGNAAPNKCLTTPIGHCTTICDPGGQPASQPGDVFVVGDSLVASKDVFPRFEVTHIQVEVDPANSDRVIDPDRNVDRGRSRARGPAGADSEPLEDADCVHDRRTYDNGIIYDGQWSGQHRHGHGVQVWPDGAMYEGQWAVDKAHGEGRFNHVDGDMYVGQWNQDKAQGRGIYFHADGSKYEGDWFEDNRHGNGVEIWPDGAKYDGQYADGLKNGTGKFILPNGSKYLGEFASNDIHGAGLYQWFDGRKYQGQYLKNQMHGAGIFTGADGHSYDGQYISDQKEGFGVFSWPDGCKYAGQWRQGRQHGSGALSTTEGETKHGSWRDGGLLDPGLYNAGEDPSMLSAARPSSANDLDRRHHPDADGREATASPSPQRRVVTGIVPPEEQQSLGPGGMPLRSDDIRPGDLQQVNLQSRQGSRPQTPPPRGKDPYLISEAGAPDAGGGAEEFRLPVYQAPKQEDKSRGCCSFNWAMPREDGGARFGAYGANGTLPWAGHRSPEDAAP